MLCQVKKKFEKLHLLMERKQYGKTKRKQIKYRESMKIFIYLFIYLFINVDYM